MLSLEHPTQNVVRLELYECFYRFFPVTFMVSFRHWVRHLDLGLGLGLDCTYLNLEFPRKYAFSNS